MSHYSVALMVYGDSFSGRNVLSEEKFAGLANRFLSAGFVVESIVYNDEVKEEIYNKLLQFKAVLVWVNPIEQGKDRKNLDALLTKLAHQGCLVSAHPEVILKIGTKEVLFTTKEMEWGSNTKLYYSYEDFVKRFPSSLEQSGIKIIKQYRGNGGNGVFKIVKKVSDPKLTVLHAKRGEETKNYSWTEFFNEFSSYFLNGGRLIEQDWNPNHKNGMVRCYLTGNKVVGFGYQEINALYEIDTVDGTLQLSPGSRYYFTENCGLFSDLKNIMESSWVPQLQHTMSISDDMLPVIWDADFFINNVNSSSAVGKYTLCEINVSSVSPFPPSAIPFIVKEIADRLNKL